MAYGPADYYSYQERKVPYRHSSGQLYRSWPTSREQLRYLKRQLEDDDMLVPFEADIYYSRGFIAGGVMVTKLSKIIARKTEK